MIHYLIADTETTGASADDTICEFAAVEVDTQLNELARHHSLIDPERRISAGASGVHGITNDMLVDSPTMAEYLAQVMHPPLMGDVVLIAHKADFDRGKLEKPFAAIGVQIVNQLCTLRLARKYLRDAEDHKLATLAYQYALDKGSSHRADGDVRTCFSLLRYIQIVSGKTLLALIDEMGRPQIMREMPFGKHKGPIAGVPKSYAQWCLGPKGLTEIDPDLRYTLALIAEGQPLPQD